MPLYMLDTDISSYFINGTHPAIDRKIRELGWEAVCISVITRCELLFGVEVSPNREKRALAVNDYLRYIPMLEFQAEAADEYAVIRGGLQRQGKLIGNNDLFIAAHARSSGLTLVTNNTREYSRVPGLKIENWAEES
jgi:tRNA(fMet)-specific endonuclease VapC